MKLRIGKIAAIAFPAILTLLLALGIIFHAVPSCSGKVDFSAVFYYVCYSAPTDSQSAASVSGVVRSYGGAGYVIENGGEYFVTISCYYDDGDAAAVVKTLGAKGLGCKVVQVQRDNISLPLSAKNKAQSYKGVLDTMLSLSRMCYDLANDMDGGARNQNAAKSVLGEINSGLSGLYGANKSNCFSSELSGLIAVCDDVSAGYVFSCDVRKLQIAICDSIIHARLY